jgi:short-subunit dehydrogenase
MPMKSTTVKAPRVKAYRRILITGASSGLGAALALAYAGPGVELFLGGRNLLRLERVAAAVREKGAFAFPHAVDVKDADRMRDWLGPISRARPFDLVIANAGVSGGTADSAESLAQIREILDVNVSGVIHTLHPVVDGMRAAGAGQIAIISSLAGFRGFPGAPAYCAGKAAVKVYGEALRPLLARNNIGVSVVCPGYIRTPMTDVNDFRMPLMMPADKAARIIHRGLARNRARIAFPLGLYMAVWLLAALPAWMTDRLLAVLPGKKNLPPTGENLP